MSDDEHDDGVRAGTRTGHLACLLVENMRRAYRISDADMDELTAGAGGMLMHADAGNPVARKLLKETHVRLWTVVAGIASARDGKTEH